MNKETDTNEVKSKRDLLLARMKEKHPDADFSDDDRLYEAVMDDYDNYEAVIAKHKEVDDKLGGMFESNPQFAGMFLSALNGDRNPVLSMIETYGDDFRAYLDDPENAESIAEANAKFVERLNSEKDLEATYEKNLEQSLMIAEELETSGPYKREQIDMAFKAVLDDASKAIMGEITAEMLETKLKGLNHDNDIQEAVEEATIRTKNQKIEAKKKTLKDELPMIDGKGTDVASDRRDPVIKRLDQITSRPDIWKDLKRN